MKLIRARHCIVLALCLTFLALTLAPLATAQSNAPNVRLHLSGPSVIGTLRTGTYSATFVDPENRDWNYKIFITAPDTTGASPLMVSPLNGTITSDNSTFTFDITAQQAAGELEIHINCTTGTLFYKKIQKITVVSPVIIRADVNNPTNVEILNATAQFFVNDIEIEMKTIPKIGAGQSIQITSEWISEDIVPGWHTSRVIIDLNGDGIIDTHAGDIIIEERFFIEGGHNWAFAITVLAGLLALIIGFGYISKRKVR